MKTILLAVAVLLATALSGCGAMNAYTGAAINAAESGAVGARQNINAIDDAKLTGWVDAACAMPVGALQRNASGNSEAVQAVLTACPIPSIAVISTKNGTISVMQSPTISAPTLTPGYVVPAAPATATPAR